MPNRTDHQYYLPRFEKALKELIDEKTSEVISALYKQSINETKQNLTMQLNDLHHKYDALFEKSSSLSSQIENARKTNIRLAEEKIELMRLNKNLTKEIMILKSK